MLTKLTLTIDQTVVRQAKKYAKQENLSVSRIVEEYLRNITMGGDSPKSMAEIHSPITDRISGMFNDNGRPYHELLQEAREEKHLN